MIIFLLFLKQTSFFEAAGAVVKFGSSPKLNHHDQVKLVQIRDTLCSTFPSEQIDGWI